MSLEVVHTNGEADNFLDPSTSEPILEEDIQKIENQILRANLAEQQVRTLTAELRLAQYEAEKIRQEAERQIEEIQTERKMTGRICDLTKKQWTLPVHKTAEE